MSAENKTPRVLNVIASLEAGGIQSIVMNIYRHIDRDKIQFDFAIREQQQKYYDEEILELGGRIFRLPWCTGNPISIIPYKNAFRNVLIEKGPFIAVHSHINFFSGLVLTEAKKGGIPIRIAHSHSISEWNDSYIRKIIWMPLMRHQILDNATHLFSCSYAAAKWLYGEEINQDPRFKRVQNGIYLGDYKIWSERENDLRKELSVPNEAILLGHIGRFDYVKNHKFLINLFAEYVKVESEAHLVLVGEGHLRTQIEKLVATIGLSDKVHFLGARSDVPEILMSLDVFILPSFFEGLGLVLVESQISGTPCVISDIVPKEVDMNMGMLRFISLKAEYRYWLKQIQSVQKISIPPWNERESKLRAAGYDIEQTIKKLKEIYLPHNYE